MTTTRARSFRKVLGHFPSGITIITALSEDGPVGFTCQSFSSLSLDPPMVLVLPGRSSTSWPRISATGRFCVNVLAAHQAHLSTTFATSGADKFAGVPWAPSPLGLPVLEGSCAWIECEIDAVHPGGDHLIVVGAVRDLGSRADSSPLLFHRGSYAKTTDLGR
ncbi:flavin reductase (DIM6/NTAB) family NADH-FMN oxidoreductase RutF [Saccharopolyspora spinosa]|uniref:Flavin reductase (DIM6/NTAB) family NADH-FMN oxidoreductase RutF n=2 Tax=Saccharopolyspora spinosa TaxID=60894 RepID=A0A2N3Y0X2_SACSN|nr:flavin reductase family protein [Saccharopolyspora spinosa]PKW16565.1 flavin reductase (DIM6/NTAB) family NADH-FMN oxidoreductase RutF [Saccharopolyspora spinosa]